MTATKKQMTAYLAVIIIYNLAASLAHPVTPSFIVERNLNSYMFGVALAVMQTTYFIFSPFWGKMCDYTSTRSIMFIGSMGYAVGQFIFMMSRTEGGVMFGRAFAGVFTGGVFTAFLNYIINAASIEERGKYLTIYATIQTVLSAVGYFVGGIMGSMISTESAFILQIILLAGCGVLFLFVCIPDNKATLKDIEPKKLAREANPLAAFIAGKTFMNSAFAAFFVVVAFCGIGMCAFEQCFNYYIRDQFGLSSAYNGIVKAVIAVVGLIANSTICMWLINKTNIHKTFLPVVIACGISVAAILVPTTVVPFFVVAVVYFAMNTVRTPLIQNVVADRAEKKNSSLVMGFYNSMNSLGGIFGALFAGLIYAADPKLPFVLGAASFGIAAVFGVIYIAISKKYPLPEKEK